ncbi:MAG: biopolymer transporter ExbD [Myxococcota bacterium]
MGGIDTGGGHGGKKSVDQEIPLIPFIDLLFCCIMFLLATAVWNQLARISANQQSPSPNPNAEPQEPDDRVKLILQVQNSGYVLASSAGDNITIPKNGDAYDMEELRAKLQQRRQMEPNRRDITVAPEDGVMYEDVVGAMDLVVGEGFPQMNLSDGAGLL